jgi:hypothetical protein
MKQGNVLCESRTLFRMSQTHSEHNTRRAATAPNWHNEVIHWMFLNYNFSKEQCVLPEDDHVIETCRSALIVLMYILNVLNNIYIYAFVGVLIKCLGYYFTSWFGVTFVASHTSSLYYITSPVRRDISGVAIATEA